MNLSRLHNDIDKAFNDVFESIFDNSLLSIGKLETIDIPSYVCISGDDYPKANIQTYKDGDKICALIEIAVPGLSKDNLQVVLEKGVLGIKGSKRAVEDLNEKNYKLRELYQRSFYRQFNLNTMFEVDENSIDVTLNDGLLQIVVKSTETERPVRKMLEIK